MPAPEVAEKPLPQPLEAMKRLMDSISENPLGRTINRWVTGESAPTGGTGSKGPFPESH